MRVLAASTVRDSFGAHGLDAREIEGFAGYAVTRCGKVFSRNHPTGPLPYYKPLRGHIDRKGYHGLTLCNVHGHFPRRVHRLVATAFHPNPDNLPCVRHINGDPADNRAENLAWATYAENEADKREHGTWETRQNGKLTKAQVSKIKARLRAGEDACGLAVQYGVNRTTITRIERGQTWGNVPCAF